MRPVHYQSTDKKSRPDTVTYRLTCLIMCNLIRKQGNNLIQNFRVRQAQTTIKYPTMCFAATSSKTTLLIADPDKIRHFL